MTSPFNQQGVAESLWLIIALPLLGAFVCGVFGRWLGRGNVQLVACGAMAGSLLLSAVVLLTVNDFNTAAISKHGMESFHYALGHDYGVWFSAGSFQVRLGLWVDHLTVTMLMVITGVGFLIHLYSTSYMAHDAGYARYFAYLNLFVANMLVLVMADNLVLTFVGWEGVGLCSYLLIGFWFTDPAKAWAGRKAFITNRIGDFGLIIGMMLLVLWIAALTTQAGPGNFQAPDRAGALWKTGLAATGPLNYQSLESSARIIVNGGNGQASLSAVIANGPLAGLTFGGVLTAAMLLFLLGAAGKSAQLPLYVWLPDAMAGPTPVSALIHAATMVTAGVYLFCRVSPLLVLAPVAMATIAIVGALTALLAALIAFAQDDIKKVLAYSTISQLGFMFMAVGMGVFWAATLHLVTHAFFKACLFLGAGSVMHGNDEETDIHKLGGLRKEMPWTWGTFLVATLAITGIVPLSGFFSKDAILHGIHETRIVPLPWVSPLVWTLGLIAAFCTAFYMVRVYWLTFEGTRSPKAKVPHAHESDAVMTSVLTLLATLSVVAVVYGIPGIQTSEPVMENFLSPVFRATEHLIANVPWLHVETGASLWAAWATAWVIALLGGGVSVFLYARYFPSVAGRPVAAPLALVQKWARDKFYVDELYESLIIRPIKFLSDTAYKVIDGFLIDTLAVRGTAWVTARTGALLRYFQTGDAQGYAAVMALAVASGVAYAFFLLK